MPAVSSAPSVSDLCSFDRYASLLSSDRPRDAEYLKTSLIILEQALTTGRIRNQDAIAIKSDLSRVIEHAYGKLRNGFCDDEDETKRWDYLKVSDALNGLYMSSLPNIKSAPKKIAAARKMLECNESPYIDTILDEIEAFSKIVSPLAEKLLDLKNCVQIVKRGDEPKAPPIPTNPDQVRGQCACCFRGIAVSGLEDYIEAAKSGTVDGVKGSSLSMVHHGYQRPGDGQQTQSCDGIRFPPYEVSKAGTQHMLDRALARVERHKRALKAIPLLNELSLAQYRPNGRFEKFIVVTKSDSKWNEALRHYTRKHENGLDQAVSDAAFFERKVSDWRYTGALRFASGQQFTVSETTPAINTKASEAEIETYTQGMCHAMAIAFSRKRGYSLLVVETAEDFEGDGGGLCVLHVYAVDDATEQAWDIRGSMPVENIPKDAEDFFANEAYSTNYVDEAELRDRYISSDAVERSLIKITEADIEEAERIVDRLYPLPEPVEKAETKAARSTGMQP